MKPRALIVGAGIVGAACARALARDGFDVAVVDPRPVGSGATAAGMGQVVVMDDSEAQFALTRYSQTLWADLSPLLPADCEVLPCGTLWVAADDEEMAEVERKHRYYTERGVAAQVLSGREVAAEEPLLREGLAGGLVVPGDIVVYPPCVARWLLNDAARRGATLHAAAATRIDGSGADLADGSRLAADVVINAAGSLAPRLTPGLPIRPRKGHLVITERYPGLVRRQVVELGYLKSAHGSDRDSVAFNVQPRVTGQLLIGSSRQFDVETTAVDCEMLRRMVGRAVEYMPGLARLSAIRTWTGFRAATPDSLPLIGPHPDEPELYLATGHEGLGITTSLGTAELLVAQLLERPAPIAVEPFLPSRFAGVAARA